MWYWYYNYMWYYIILYMICMGVYHNVKYYSLYDQEYILLNIVYLIILSDSDIY